MLNERRSLSAKDGARDAVKAAQPEPVKAVRRACLLPLTCGPLLS
jgi:hypothetical protein